MKPHRPACPHQGFSLIELILIIVVLAIAAIGIASMNTAIFDGQSSNKNIESSTTIMQQCAEALIALRQKTGYYATDLASATAAQAYCRTVTGNTSLTVSSGSGTGGCPTGSTCKQFKIHLVSPDIVLLLAN